MTTNVKKHKMDRKINVVLKFPFSPVPSGVLKIVQNDQTTYYRYDELEGDSDGRCFRLDNFGSNFGTESCKTVATYHCRISGKQSSCDCPGNIRWKHCKHVEGLTALLEAKRI